MVEPQHARATSAGSPTARQPAGGASPNRAELLSLSDRAPTFPQASNFNGQYQVWAICSCDFGVCDIAKSDLRDSIAVRWQAQRRTAHQPAYVATTDSTAHPRITAA